MEITAEQIEWFAGEVVSFFAATGIVVVVVGLVMFAVYLTACLGQPYSKRF